MRGRFYLAQVTKCIFDRKWLDFNGNEMKLCLAYVLLPAVLQMFNIISSTRTPCVNEQENEYNEETSFGWDSRGWDDTCPYICVLWTEMCRGVYFWNSDVESCRSDLKCPRTYDSKAYSIIKMNLQITEAQNHYYCLMVREAFTLNKIVWLCSIISCSCKFLLLVV